MQITRRSALRGGTATVAAIAVTGAVAARVAVDDPVVHLEMRFREADEAWSAAEVAAEDAKIALGDLFRGPTPRYPRPTALVGNVRRCYSEREILQIGEGNCFGPTPTQEQVESALAALRASKAQYLAVRERYGLAALEREKEAAEELTHALELELETAVPTSLEGVAAKLRYIEWSADISDDQHAVTAARTALEGVERLWKRVLAAVKEIQREEPREGEAVN